MEPAMLICSGNTYQDGKPCNRAIASRFSAFTVPSDNHTSAKLLRLFPFWSVKTERVIVQHGSSGFLIWCPPVCWINKAFTCGKCRNCFSKAGFLLAGNFELGRFGIKSAIASNHPTQFSGSGKVGILSSVAFTQNRFRFCGMPKSAVSNTPWIIL